MRGKQRPSAEDREKHIDIALRRLAVLRNQDAEQWASSERGRVADLRSRDPDAECTLSVACGKELRQRLRRMPTPKELDFVEQVMRFVWLYRHVHPSFKEAISALPKIDKKSIALRGAQALGSAVIGLREIQQIACEVARISADGDEAVVQSKLRRIDDLSRALEAEALHALPGLEALRRGRGAPPDPGAPGAVADNAATQIARGCGISYEKALDLVCELAPHGSDLKSAARQAKKGRLKGDGPPEFDDFGT